MAFHKPPHKALEQWPKDMASGQGSLFLLCGGRLWGLHPTQKQEREGGADSHVQTK